MRRHPWLLLVVGALAGSLATGAAAVSVTSGAFWRTFASGTDNNRTFAAATGGVTRPRIVAVRVSKNARVQWVVTCEGTVNNAPANTPVVIGVNGASRCLLTGSASSPSSGKLTLQLVRR